MDKETQLKAEIIRGRRNSKIYTDLSKGMNYHQIKRMTELALDMDNMPAVKGLAVSNQFAVAEALSSREGLKMIGRRASTGDTSAPELFFMLRGNLSEQARPIFKRLARQTILKVSRGIVGKGLRGSTMVRVPATPESEEFDLDITIENYLEKGYLTYEDIIAIERREKSKNGVLIFDTSGSLYGKRFVTAALAVAVLAYQLAHDDYSVILFNTKPYVIKHVEEKLTAEEVIDRILDSESAGYTNISEALQVAGTELKKMKTRQKFAILVTDGAFNRGGDPRKYVQQIPVLHVLGLPSKHEWGERVCKDLTRLGRGRYIQVQTYQHIPQAIVKLLRDT